MKIAVLMASAGSRLGGLETIAREFASGLAGRGHDVTLVTGVGPGAALQPDLRSDVQGAVSVANPAGLARLAPPYRPYRPYGLCTVPMLGQASAPARMIASLRGLHPAIVEARTFLAATWRSHPAMDALRRADVISAHYEVEA